MTVTAESITNDLAEAEPSVVLFLGAGVTFPYRLDEGEHPADVLWTAAAFIGEALLPTPVGVGIVAFGTAHHLTDGSSYRVRVVAGVTADDAFTVTMPLEPAPDRPVLREAPDGPSELVELARECLIGP